MASFIEGIFTGIVFGSLVGFIKYAVLWRSIIKTEETITAGALYIRMGISMAINIAALFLVFLTREMVPFSFAATLIATAVTLSIAGKVTPMREVFNKTSEEKNK